MVKAMLTYEKVKKVLYVSLETLVYVICNLFIAALLCIIAYFAAKLLKEEEIVRYYATGIMLLIFIGLSLGYISKYNKKYFKNDSDSSKRQNDFFFDEDIRREEGRYFNRRNVE